MGESGIQIILMRWWHEYCITLGLDERLLFAIPNQAARDPVNGARMKAEGLRRGVPDMFLSIPRHHWHGLYIEQKREDGVPSSHQLSFMPVLASQGYLCTFSYTLEDSRWLVENYLTQPASVVEGRIINHTMRSV